MKRHVDILVGNTQISADIESETVDDYLEIVKRIMMPEQYVTNND